MGDAAELPPEQPGLSDEDKASAGRVRVSLYDRWGVDVLPEGGGSGGGSLNYVGTDRHADLRDTRRQVQGTGVSRFFCSYPTVN